MSRSSRWGLFLGGWQVCRAAVRPTTANTKNVLGNGPFLPKVPHDPQVLNPTYPANACANHRMHRGPRFSGRLGSLPVAACLRAVAAVSAGCASAPGQIRWRPPAESGSSTRWRGACTRSEGTGAVTPRNSAHSSLCKTRRRHAPPGDPTGVGYRRALCSTPIEAMRGCIVLTAAGPNPSAPRSCRSQCGTYRTRWWCTSSTRPSGPGTRAQS